jgi:hypothetical protein
LSAPQRLSIIFSVALGAFIKMIHTWLQTDGFKKIEISVVAREDQPPHFQTILASGEKA